MAGAMESRRLARAAAAGLTLTGAWLLVASVLVQPRGLPAVHDAALGVLLLTCAALWESRWMRWLACFAGLWLLLAPLALGVDSAAAYLSDSLAGVAAVVFSVVLPDVPGSRSHAREPAQAPPGWSYNPSAWRQRAPPVALALVGFGMAAYLTLYQIGAIRDAWDPFFGRGTERVLDSRVSEAFPLPDAGLGAIGYLLDALAGVMGGARRWRTAPWTVVLFGVFVIPFGVVSITLVVLQPVAVGAWCTLCLATAIVSLLMIPFAVDEVVASAEYLVAARRAGLPLWGVFWRGGEDVRPPREARGEGGGISWSWPLGVAALLGVATMAAPALLGIGGRAADALHVAGPLVVTFAIIALAEVTRTARLVLLPAGLGIAAAPWLFGEASFAAAAAVGAAGLAVAALSVPRGAIRGRYGGWTRYVA